MGFKRARMSDDKVGDFVPKLAFFRDFKGAHGCPHCRVAWSPT
jgi:hypothetical protein